MGGSRKGTDRQPAHQFHSEFALTPSLVRIRHARQSSAMIEVDILAIISPYQPGEETLMGLQRV